MKSTFFVLMVMSGAAYAAGDGQGSVKDLIPSVLNVLILGSFLIYKIKKPLRDMFIKKSEDIEKTIERAAVKEKESKLLLEQQVKKLGQLERDIESIFSKNQTEVENFKKNYEDYINKKILKLREDAALKISTEKKAQLEQLNQYLVDDVIANAKKLIKGSQEKQKRIGEKMVKAVQ